MKRRYYRCYRLLGKLALLMAALPLFQFAQCATGVRQVGANMTNSLPYTVSSIMQGFVLLPAQILLSILFPSSV